jgi:hypothetical protein
MIRNSVALLVLLAPPAARAQDMPLSQILIEGEGWKVDRNSGRPRPNEPYALSPDRGTVFYAKPDERFLFAYSVTPGVVNGESFKPYAPLRTRRGEQTIRVTGLTVDRDGRIYASTEIGVQVFDPTGRLCGVLTPAAQGVPYGMGFEGDRLTMWIGDTKYARKLNTAGPN